MCSETSETSWELPAGVAMSEVEPFTADDERFLPDDDLEAHGLALAVSDDLEAADGDGAAAGTGDQNPPSMAPATVDEHLQAMVALFPAQLDAEYDTWRGVASACHVGPLPTGEGALWAPHSTESRGHKAGEVYYVHKHTGETLWDTPTGVVTPQQLSASLDVGDLVQQAAEMAGEEGGVGEALEYIGIPNADTWVQACTCLHEGSGDATEALRALQALLAVLSEAGEDGEWAAAAEADEHEVIRAIISCLQPAAPPALRTSAVQLLFILNQMQPSTLQGTVRGTWGIGLRSLLAMCAAGLWNAIMGCKYVNTVQMWPPRLGGSRRKSVSAWHAGAVDSEAAATWLMYAASVLHSCKELSVQPPRQSLCSFLAVLLDITAVLPWTVQCRVAWTDAMVAVYNFATPEFDPLLAVAVGDARGRAIADGLLAVLQNSTEFTEQGDLSAPEATICSALQLLEHLLSRPATAAVVFTADLRVLADIALRQLADGGAGSGTAAQWVSLLRVLLLDGRLVQAGSSPPVYRMEDVAAALEELLDADGSDGHESDTGDWVAEEVTRLTQETAHLWE